MVMITNCKILFTTFIFVVLTASGCQTTDIDQGTEQSLDRPHVTKFGDGWFYTYPFTYSDLDRIKPTFKDPRLMVVLEYEDGCLYFNNGHQRTTPLLPYGQAFWDDDNKVLNYFASDYYIGDTIESPGYILTSEQKRQFKNKQGKFNSQTGFVTVPRSSCELDQVTYLFSLPPGVLDPTPYL